MGHARSVLDVVLTKSLHFITLVNMLDVARRNITFLFAGHTQISDQVADLRALWASRFGSQFAQDTMMLVTRWPGAHCFVWLATGCRVCDPVWSATC